MKGGGSVGIDTTVFILFFLAGLMLYYAVPERFRPPVLTAESLLFAASYDLRCVLYLLGTAGLIWWAGLFLGRQESSGGEARQLNRKKRRILQVCLMLLVGMLVLLKYIGPSVLQGTGKASALQIFVPIGISYYTLQAISYTVDVYWGRIAPEKRFFRVLLFLSYFPQLLEGPISRYDQLSRQLYHRDHSFQIRNLKFGIQLMLWGYFKVFVVSEHIAGHVRAAFYGETPAYGLAAFLGLVLFGIQLYGNFSGGIDIIRGASRCFAVSLPENFNQPFFSRSLGEFWRRWHITLGTWVKDYIFYPLSMSRWISACKRRAKKHISRKRANRLAIAFADVAAFLAVGIWHGLGGNYVLWGLYNGVILAFSELMADSYQRGREALHIEKESRLWQSFSLVRTFLIVTLGWFTDCAASASGALQILLNMLQLSETNLEVLQYSTALSRLLLAAGLLALVTVDLLHEKKISIREKVDSWPAALQMLFWIGLIQAVALLGGGRIYGGFIYANF